MSLRIALLSHLASPHEVTGAERSLLNLARELHAAGDEIHFLSPLEGRSVEEARALAASVRVLAWPRLFLASYESSLPMTAARLLRFAAESPKLPRLRWALEEIRPDVALLNTLVNTGAARMLRAARVPFLWRIAEITGPGLRRSLLARAAVRLPDRLVAVSAAVAKALEPARAQVIHSGVAVPDPPAVAAARGSLRDTLGLARDAVVLGHVGQVLPHKGQLELVEAVVAHGIPGPATLAILGSEEADSGYARRIRAAGEPLGERLRFAGFVPGAGRAAAGLDVLAFTSTAPDPFPLVVLEAMAAGVPVVAFAAGGVPEAVAEGETGLLVPPGDRAGLARALATLAGDAGLRRRLGEAARARVLRLFTLERAGANYRKALVEIARDGSRDGATRG